MMLHGAWMPYNKHSIEHSERKMSNSPNNKFLYLIVDVLDRYAKRKGNSVLVRSQKRAATCQNRRVEHTAADKRKHFADPFWLLASGFSYPAALWRDIKGAALANLARFARKL